jgi:hypothetical protein
MSRVRLDKREYGLEESMLVVNASKRQQSYKLVTVIKNLVANARASPDRALSKLTL